MCGLNPYVWPLFDWIYVCMIVMFDLELVHINNFLTFTVTFVMFSWTLYNYF